MTSVLINKLLHFDAHINEIYHHVVFTLKLALDAYMLSILFAEHRNRKLPSKHCDIYQ